MLASDIKRFLDRPFAPANRTDTPTAPPGAPIGDPGMDWLGRLAPYCGWEVDCGYGSRLKALGL